MTGYSALFWWCGEHGRFLYEGYTKGFCPLCLKNANGNICESCGHPNHPGDLLHARCSADHAHRLERRPLTLLYLEVEKYRGALRTFYDRERPLWRPHLRAFADDLLARPLADLPVSDILNNCVRHVAERIVPQFRPFFRKA